MPAARGTGTATPACDASQPEILVYAERRRRSLRSRCRRKSGRTRTRSVGSTAVCRSSARSSTCCSTGTHETAVQMISRLSRSGSGGIRRERQRLVPVRDGRDVVLELQVAPAAAPAERLHRDRQVGAEPDRVGEMPTVEAEALLRPVLAVGPQHLGHARVRRRELGVVAADVEVVRAAEVVLGAGSADRRELVVAVDEELHLALAPPAGVVHAPRAIRADVLAATVHAVEDPHDLARRQRD